MSDLLAIEFWGSLIRLIFLNNPLVGANPLAGAAVGAASGAIGGKFAAPAAV